MTTRLEVLRRAREGVQREDLEKIVKEQVRPVCEASSADEISNNVLDGIENAFAVKGNSMRETFKEIVKEAVREVLAEEV